MGFISSYKALSSGRRGPVPQNRSASTGAGTVARFVEALRSRAPGGWSDDRYEQSKHFVGIVYTCLHRLCEQMAQSEFQVYIKDPHSPQGKREITRSDPPNGERQRKLDVRPYDLVELLERPNTVDSFGDLAYKWLQQGGMTGSSLTWMVPNELLYPMELYSIPTCTALPMPVMNPEYPNGFYRIQPLYPYGPFSSTPSPYSAVGAPIPTEWIMACRLPHPFLHYEGYSPLTAMRMHIDEVEMIDRSRFYTMKRSINPSAVLNFDEMEGMQPLPEKEVARIHAEWEANFQGPQNHGRLVVGVPGAKLEEWGRTSKDMEFSQGWEQLTSFVMAGLGISKPAAAMVDNSSYSTLYATLKQLHLLTLEPWCSRFGSRLTRDLAPFFGDDLIVEIRCKRIDDPDIKRSNAQVLLQGKAIKKGELRQLFDMPLTGAKWEDEVAGEMPQQQQGMPGMPGLPGAGPPDAGGIPVGNGQSVGAPPQPGAPAGTDGASLPPPIPVGGGSSVSSLPLDEIEAERPAPGNLSAGSLGPRMKSFYQRIREGLHGSNGNGNGNGKAGNHRVVRPFRR